MMIADAKPLVLDGDLGPVAREHCYVMPGVERLGDDVPSRSAGTAEHQEFHDGRILAPPAPPAPQAP